MPEYPKYSELIRLKILADRVEEIEAKLQANASGIRSGSFIIVSGSSNAKAGRIERAALTVLDAKQELQALDAEQRTLFEKIKADIDNGPGGPEEKKLCFLYFCLNMDMRKSIKAAGLKQKEGWAYLTNYMQTCREQEERIKNDEQ